MATLAVDPTARFPTSLANQNESHIRQRCHAAPAGTDHANLSSSGVITAETYEVPVDTQVRFQCATAAAAEQHCQEADLLLIHLRF
jgi:hypothetical protein